MRDLSDFPTTHALRNSMVCNARMAPRLNPKTERHVAELFPLKSKEEVVELLLHQCGNNLPFCEKDDEFQLERVRFAALKLSQGDLRKLREAIKLAQTDWRDLLMAVHGPVLTNSDVRTIARGSTSVGETVSHQSRSKRPLIVHGGMFLVRKKGKSTY